MKRKTLGIVKIMTLDQSGDRMTTRNKFIIKDPKKLNFWKKQAARPLTRCNIIVEESP